MKKSILAIATIISIITTCFIMQPVFADTMIDKSITAKIEFKKDKNGATYARTFIKENKTLNGVEYQADVPVMFFGSSVAAAKKLIIGSKLKAIVSESDFKGRTSYTVIAVL
jgi:hypothetical protein